MDTSQRINKWLLGGLAVILLLVGVELRAKQFRSLHPELAAMERRAAFLRAWQPGIPIGSKAPDFTLKEQHGEAHSLFEFRGRPPLLMFNPNENGAVSLPGKTKNLGKPIRPQKNAPGGGWGNSPGKGAFFFRGKTKNPAVYLF